MTPNSPKPLEIFNFVMIVAYVLLGIFMLAVPTFFGQFTGWPRIALSIMLVLYGFFRGYLTYTKQSALKRRNRNITLVLLLPIAIGSCKVDNTKAGAWSDMDTVTVSVDETFKPVIQSGYEVFMSNDTLSEMYIRFMAENLAITELLNGKTTMAIASRDLTKEEREYMKSKKLFPRSTHIATDAIAIIVHKSNPDSVFSVNEIRQILTGERKNWKQVSPSQKNLPIRVLFDNKESGILKFMVDSICKGQKLTDETYALEYNQDVVEFVSTHEDAIGFIGASWISDPNDTLHLSFHNKIKVLGICSGVERSYADSYKPYQAYMLNDMYPFTRDIYMINAEPKDGKATRFCAFMANDKGQRIILKSGILPTVAPTRMVNVRSNL